MIHVIATTQICEVRPTNNIQSIEFGHDLFILLLYYWVLKCSIDIMLDVIFSPTHIEG